MRSFTCPCLIQSDGGGPDIEAARFTAGFASMRRIIGDFCTLMHSMEPVQYLLGHPTVPPAATADTADVTVRAATVDAAAYADTDTSCFNASDASNSTLGLAVTWRTAHAAAEPPVQRLVGCLRNMQVRATGSSDSLKILVTFGCAAVVWLQAVVLVRARPASA